MSLLAKIFVVIVTVLSLVFLGMQSALYQHRRDWRTSYTQLQQRYQELSTRATREINSLRTQVSTQRRFIETKDQEVRTLREAVRQEIESRRTLQDQVSQQTRDLAAARDLQQSQQRTIEQQRNDYAALNRQKDELEAQRQTAVRNEEIAEAQVARLMTLKSELEQDNGDLRQQLHETRRNLRDKELILAMLRERGVDVEAIIVQQPVPKIDGVVVAVRAVPEDPTHPLVLLSVGEEDEVEEGYQFTIHRNDQFVGRVQIVRVLRDMAGARVLFTRDEATSIQPGDNASTRIE